MAPGHLFGLPLGLAILPEGRQSCPPAPSAPCATGSLGSHIAAVSSRATHPVLLWVRTSWGQVRDLWGLRGTPAMEALPEPAQAQGRSSWVLLGHPRMTLSLGALPFLTRGVSGQL